MPLPVIAQRQGISEKYLESIIAVLARAGLVEGQRGKGGGYRLSRELKDYSVGEIVRLTEGSLAPVSCLEGENTCPRADKCLSLPVWEKLDTLINDYLDSVSLADLLAEGGTVAGRMAVLAEGDAKNRDDIKFLAPLPTFKADGSVR